MVGRTRKRAGPRRGVRSGLGRGGLVGLGRLGLLSWAGGFGFTVFSFSFLFLNKSNLNEFKPNLNSNPMHSTKQIKLMHQHECTNKFKPKINFNYLRNKILD